MFDNNPSTVVIFFLQIRECCEGFYGPDCLPCPGPIGHPCFGNGEVSYIFFHCDCSVVSLYYTYYLKHLHFLQCSKADGTCKCRRNFQGTACELCAEKKKYGLDCAEGEFVYMPGRHDNRG